MTFDNFETQVKEDKQFANWEQIDNDFTVRVWDRKSGDVIIRHTGTGSTLELAVDDCFAKWDA